MISVDALKLLDALTLSFSGAFACCSLLSAVYAVPWSRCSSPGSAVKDYNRFWTVRLCLQLTAAFWLVCPYIQYYQNWRSYLSSGHPSTGQDVLCRVFILLRTGFLEPFFFLLSLLTFRHVLFITEKSNSAIVKFTVNFCFSFLPTWKQQSGQSPPKRPIRNSRIILTATFWAALVCALQSAIILLERDHAKDAQDTLNLPRSTLMPFTNSIVCWGDSELKPCIVCVVPLISTLMTAVVVVCFLYHSWKVTIRMGQLAINQSIEKRMRLFRSSVTVLLVFSVAFRGLSVIWRPGEALHEFCKFADFLSMLSFVVALSVILVIRPVREARIADKNTKSVPITLW